MARYAYAARYGHQPLSELRKLTISELDLLIECLGAIVDSENGTSNDDDE